MPLPWLDSRQLDQPQGVMHDTRDRPPHAAAVLVSRDRPFTKSAADLPPAGDCAAVARRAAREVGTADALPVC